MKYNKGFTLIELLVVIAIIGILASVVLAALTSARTKGQAAAVQSQLSNMRAQAELYYATNTNYGTGYATTAGGLAATSGANILPTGTGCATEATAATSMFNVATAGTAGIGYLMRGACNSGASAMTGSVDAATATKWAVYAVAPGPTYYCADSSGNSKSYAAAQTPFGVGSLGVCP